MAPRVQIGDETEQALHRLQAKIELATGQRPSMQQLLARIIELAEAHEDELVQEDTVPQLSEERKQEILSMGEATGDVTSEEDIDDILYGGPDGPA